ncbi:hypothetical protein BUALT_Bualt03G0053600 [Buddleja alternifolia]|uniref:Uncharacterized protein n=1 Tax=Buddleja alternifolia TaxID=168488 RepID=A0AAV6XSR5_9LAMI|nr:hypothetical protein BUALT_Bualt03G0053600 [Buddleja alternifolia]
MVMEGNQVRPNGWPLGLRIMSTRIGVVDASQTAAPPLPYPPRRLRSSSFSSFSSSNLDTQSTASFFPDQSVSLGWLIGIRPTNKGIFYHRKVTDERSNSPVVHRDHTHNSHGLCAPLIHHVIGRMGRSSTTSRN